MPRPQLHQPEPALTCCADVDARQGIHVLQSPVVKGMCRHDRHHGNPRYLAAVFNEQAYENGGSYCGWQCAGAGMSCCDLLYTKLGGAHTVTHSCTGVGRQTSCMNGGCTRLALMLHDLLLTYTQAVERLSRAK